MPLSLTLWLLFPPLLRSRPEPKTLRVTVLDVGQGDCICVQTPSGRVLLIDGGGANDESAGAHERRDAVGERVVLPFLRYEGINRVDVLVLTHPHGDHVGGLPAVLRDEEIGAVLDGTRLPYPSPSYTEFLRLVRQKRIPYAHAARGMTINLGDGVRADVLNPPADGFPYGTGGDDATVNNYSAVLLLTDGRTRFLLTGDAETAAEDAIEAAAPDLSADVLKVGHHGAGNATGDSWLARVRPRFAAISCGAHNVFGHPAPATVARLAAHHVQTYCTAWNGAITFVSDGRTVTAHPFLPAPGARN